MNVKDFLSPEDVLVLEAGDKRELLRVLARHAAARFGLGADNLLRSLGEREALGSTGVGAGVALPHARLVDLGRAHGVFARLARPIGFNSVDDAPVDLVFLVLLPASVPELHMKPLASVSRRLRGAGVTAALRKAGDGKALFALLTE